MIGIIFRFGNEIVEVRIDRDNLFFRSQNTGNMLIPFENLKLSKSGVIKEFPELTDKENWRDEAIMLFKKRFKSFITEKERIDYVIDDLKKYGYVPLYMQKEGHRVTKIK